MSRSLSRPIFSTAACAASLIETERSQYSTPYFFEDLERVGSPRRRARGRWRSSWRGRARARCTPLITPRATRSARVLETTFDITAIFSTPGFERMSLRQPLRLAHARVAAERRVVRRPAAVLAHRVGERERAAAGADHQPDVAVELDDRARDAARILGVDLRRLDLERRRLARRARVVGADAELVEDRLLRDADLRLPCRRSSRARRTCRRRAWRARGCRPA